MTYYEERDDIKKKLSQLLEMEKKKSRGVAKGAEDVARWRNSRQEKRRGLFPV